MTKLRTIAACLRRSQRRAEPSRVRGRLYRQHRGRIISSFTRNWLVGKIPDGCRRRSIASIWAIGTGPCALVFLAAVPVGKITGAALALAAALHTIRLLRWAGLHTWREPLLLVLHVGYCFVPFGFALTALAALELAPASAGIHAFTVGAVGTLTLAVMTRASLGHTGRELTASVPTQVIYAAIVLAALARVLAALEPGWSGLLPDLTALAWVTAFIGFCIVYGPALWSARKSKAQTV